MKPTRKTQPYRKGAPRPQGRTLAAMLRGAKLDGHNPMDLQREIQKQFHRRKKLSQRIR